MRNNVFRKNLAVLIIVLFVGTSIVSGFNLELINTNNPKSFARGNILYVGGSGSENYSSIQSAIDDANDGDTVFVFSGTYYEYINVDKSINLIGENSNNTIIDGKGGVNHNPVNTNPSPSKGATDVELLPSNFSIYVSDPDGDTMNITFWTNESGTWQVAQTYNNVTNGTYYLTNKSWVDNLGTIYWWRVNTIDGENGFDIDTYSFITIGRQKFRLWALADTHVKLIHYYPFFDAIIDSNTAFIWNASIVIGDIIHNDLKDCTYPEYNRFQQVRNFSLHGVQDFYPIYGNHEMYHNASGWPNWTKQIDPVGDHLVGNNTNENRTYDMIYRLDESHPLSNSTDSRYYFAVGNLLFVTFGPFPGVRNHTIWFEWFKTIVENNTDMNIIVYTHFPLPSSGLLPGGSYQWDDSITYESWLNSTSTTISLWLSGHSHTLGEVIYNSTTTYNDWNITFINPGNILDRRSTLLNFTDGSSLAILGRYNHKINNWIFNTTVNLTYPFDIDYVYSPPINYTQIHEWNNIPKNTTINWQQIEDWNATSNNTIICYKLQELNTTLKNTYSKTCLQNDKIGIEIGRNTLVISNSLISGFTLSGDNTYNSVGIYSHLNSNNITIENCIIHNYGDGILFVNGSNNIIIRNCTTYNNSRRGGISFAWQDINEFEITGCSSYQNSYGINIEKATNGLIYHNNFFNNDVNGYDSGNNTWDDGKYGNYWDDYIKKYPKAHKILLKGTWNTPYDVPGGDDQDNFPLIKPFNKPRIRTVNTPLKNILSYNMNFFIIILKLLKML